MPIFSSLQSFIFDKLNQKYFLAAALITSCLFLAYGNTFENKFMMDDYVYLVGNDNLSDRSFTEIWTKDYHKFYRPVGFMMLRLVNSWSGNNPGGYQIATFAVFAVVCFLFYVVLLKLFKDEPLALLAVILYAVHPINNSLINYKTELINLVYIICMQVSTLFFLNFLDKEKKWLYGVSLLFYLAALLSHEISFMLPMFLFLVSVYLRNVPFRKIMYLCLGYGVILGIYVGIRMNIIHAIKVPSIFDLGLTLGQYIDLLRRSLGWYFKQLIWPHQILLVWDEEILDKFQFGLNLIFILFLIVTGRWAFLKGKSSKVGFCWLFFLIGFLPVFFISFIHTYYLHTAIMEPHWFGYSSIGFFVLLALGVIRLRPRVNQRIWFVGVVALIVILGLVTRKSNAYWKDDIAYAQYWAQENKSNADPVFRLLNLSVYNQSDDVNKFQSCEEISRLGMHYLIHVQREDLAVHYNKLALKKDSDCACAHFFFGLYNYTKGNFEQASLSVNNAHHINPDIYPSYEVIENLFEDAIDKRKASSRVKVIRLFLGFKN